MDTAAQVWISRVIGAIDNYIMTDKTTEDDLAPMIAELILDAPSELVNDVVRDISRYAIAKQQEYNKQRTNEVVAASTPPLPEDDDQEQERGGDKEEERGDDDQEEEERSDDDDGDIQNAYNEMQEMIRDLVPASVALKHIEEWPEIAYEVDKWGYMLLHHLITKFAPLSVIEAVMKENPEALTVEVGDIDGHVPLQLAVRVGRSLEVIRALYEANPQMVKKVSPRGDTAHSLACKYKRDVSIKVFLYTNRDAAPLPAAAAAAENESMLLVDPRQHNEDFFAEFARTIGMKEAYPVLIILVAWVFMLTMSMLAGVRMMI